ncbi:ACT domain-containing protein [Candidatus Micrarchaeota archaeon]|nr:ACT domain-containing protein [Candidatus Micrarchaeota archaeon]
MKDLSVITDDKVGLLADISYILGKARVNIESLSATSVGGKAIITLLVKNSKKASEVLERNGFKISSGNVIFVKLEDKPGTLSEVAKLLAENKINVGNLNLISRDGRHTVVGVTVDRPRKAKKVLDPFLIENSETL